MIFFRTAFVAILLELFCVALPGPAVAHDYYVSPSGVNAADGSRARPFRTLSHVVHLVGPGDTVYLRQGVYRETLYALHGGTAAAPIVFRPYAKETVVLAGSDVLGGVWKLWHGRVWCMDKVSATTDLFLDGQELPEARWPALAPGAAMTAGWATTGPGTDASGIHDPALPHVDLTGAGVLIVPGLGWVGFTRTVKSFAQASLAFQSPVDRSPAYVPRVGNRYYLYGSLALLNAPGQWYQDSSTGRLYLWAPGGDDPTGHRVEAARRKLVVYDNGFSYVELRDLFTFCGGVKISRCTGCRLESLNQRYVQHYTSVQGYDAEGPANGMFQCRGCDWSAGSIVGSSGDGLAVSGAGNRVAHMLIHDVDRAAGYAAAIALLGQDETVEDNTCYDGGRMLVDLGDAKGGVVRGNELFNAGLLTNDVGAIYAYRANGGGMVIAYNNIHGVAAVRGMGIYLDNGDSNYIVHHNLVRDCAWAAIELNLPSWNNRVFNNTLWNCRHWVWADGVPHSMTGTVIENNLCGGTALLVKGKLGPAVRDNASFLQPPALFKPGTFELAVGSPAIGRGMAAPPYTDGWSGSGPDLGAFAYGVPAWTAGCVASAPSFPYPEGKAYADSRSPRGGFWRHRWW